MKRIAPLLLVAVIALALGGSASGRGWQTAKFQIELLTLEPAAPPIWIYPRVTLRVRWPGSDPTTYTRVIPRIHCDQDGFRKGYRVDGQPAFPYHDGAWLETWSYWFPGGASNCTLWAYESWFNTRQPHPDQPASNVVSFGP